MELTCLRRADMFYVSIADMFYVSIADMFYVSIAPDTCLHLSPCAIVTGLAYKVLEGMGTQNESRNVSFK